MKRILVVEDDTTMNKMISFNLKSEGYKIDSAYTVQQSLSYLTKNPYQLVIIDINLPDGSGYEICKTIKHDYKHTPVIFLTANDLEKDMIHGFNLGAIDYITKPFSINVLRHKVKAMFSLLDNTNNSKPRVVFNDEYLIIDFSGFTAAINGKSINFAPMEFRMLKILVENNNILLTRQKLLEKLWDSQEKYVDEHTLTTTISRIRSKIEDKNHKYIKTVYGMGYMWIGGDKQ